MKIDIKTLLNALEQSKIKLVYVDTYIDNSVIREYVRKEVK